MLDFTYTTSPHLPDNVQAQFLREYKLVVVGGGGKKNIFTHREVEFTDVSFSRRRKVCADNPVHSKSLR